TAEAESRAANAEKKLADLSKQNEVTSKQVEAVSKKQEINKGTDGMEFSAYARTGLLINSHGKGGRGGPGVSPASSLNDDAHTGRLGNEKDNYLELSLGKRMTFSDGSWAHFK